MEGNADKGISLVGEELNMIFILENIYEGIYKDYPIDLDLIEVIKKDSF